MTTSVQSFGNLVGERWVASNNERKVLHKYTGEPLAIVQEADKQIVADAVTAAVDAFEAGSPPPQERFEILRRVAELIADERDALAQEITRETGFTLKDCLKRLV